LYTNDKCDLDDNIGIVIRRQDSMSPRGPNYLPGGSETRPYMALGQLHLVGLGGGDADALDAAGGGVEDFEA